MEERIFYIVNVYNYHKDVESEITLARWFETKLTSKIYPFIENVETPPATVFAVEIKDTPCDCEVIVTHTAQIDYIEERAYDAGSGGYPNGGLI